MHSRNTRPKVLVKLHGEIQPKFVGEIKDEKEAVGRKRLDHCKRYFCEGYFGLLCFNVSHIFSVPIRSSIVVHAPAAYLVFSLQ